MLFPIQITLRAKPAGESLRAWRAATQAGWQAVGEQWHTEMLPEHFLPSAWGKYHYRPRSRMYLARKLRAGKGRNPLEYTGLMRELLTGSQIIRAFPTRATVKMLGPRYVTMRTIANLSAATQAKIRAGRGSTRVANQPDKIRELTTVTAPERKTLGQTLRATIREHLARKR